MSRVLVTGGTGFLGAHLIHLLLEQGHEVVALVRESAHVIPIGSHPAHGDILDAASVEAAAQDCEAVFHCAGKVSRDPADAEELQRIHVEGTKTVLDACKKAGVRRAVVASTSGTVALTRDAKEIRNEDAPAPMDLIAAFPYYRSKLFAEMAALERNAPDFEVVVVCPTLLLGPGDARGSSTGDVVDFLDGRVPFIPGGGLSFVDARDAAQALILAFESGVAGERYLVAAQNLTLEAFFRKLERISGVHAPTLRAPANPWLAKVGVEIDKRIAKRLGTAPRLSAVSAEMAQYFWYVDSTKARDVLGWEPRDPMETLADTVTDLRARGVVWPDA